MMKSVFYSTLIFLSAVLACQSGSTPEQSSAPEKPIRVLIIDGQNNHGIWPKTTVMMKAYLEETGLFNVDIDRTVYAWLGPHNDGDENLDEAKRLQLLDQFPVSVDKNIIMVNEPRPDPDFSPVFSDYDVVISNFGWQASSFPQQTQKALEDFVSGGGGLIIVHAASNSFPEWDAFNKMIGLGAWGDRSEKDGPYVYYDRSGQLVHDTTAGGAGSHGRQHEYVVEMRDDSHPITQGMPARWKHAKDELYDRLRGPAENMTILATVFSDVEQNASTFSPLKGTDRHEPIMLTVNFGEGRVFHTPMGHTDYSMECVGFITMLQRSAEWAATGKVTQDLPVDFPGEDKVSIREWRNGR